MTEIIAHFETDELFGRMAVRLGKALPCTDDDQPNTTLHCQMRVWLYEDAALAGEPLSTAVIDEEVNFSQDDDALHRVFAEHRDHLVNKARQRIDCQGNARAFERVAEERTKKIFDRLTEQKLQ